jgi:hypothetical protein
MTMSTTVFQRLLSVPIHYVVHHPSIPNHLTTLLYIGNWRKLDMRIHHHLLLYVLLFVSYYFSCTESLSRTDFPAGFIFGGASSAYQVYITLIYRLNYAFYIHYVYLILMLFLGFVLISIQSMKVLHINMEKGLAYGTLSLGYIQVSHSHHSSFFMNKLFYSIKRINVQIYKRKQNKLSN